jgi:Rrf2 family protein
MGTATLAAKIDAPPNYLGKLLQTLARHGLVDSRKGLGGGFSLARVPGEIRLLDVVEPMEQVDRFSGCFLGRAECSDADPCALHDRWADLRDRYLAILSETTLAELLETGRDAVDLSADPGSARRVARNPTGNPKSV